MITSYEAGRRWAADAAKTDLAVFAEAWQERVHTNCYPWTHAVTLAQKHWQDLGETAELDVREFVRGVLDAGAITKNTVQSRVTPIKRPLT